MKNFLKIGFLFSSIIYKAVAQDAGNINLEQLQLKPYSPNKYALVLGVESYPNLREKSVKNALNDATAVAKALQAKDEEFTVRYVENIKTSSEIRTQVHEIITQADHKQRPSLILIYFAGHGFQNNGANYIVPSLAGEDSLKRDSLNIAELTASLNSANVSLGFVVVDACRTAGRDAGEGDLVKNKEVTGEGFAVTNGSSDTVIFLSTGNSAAWSISTQSEYANNSPFSGPFASFFRTESQSLSRLFGEIRAALNKEYPTRNQIPQSLSTADLSNIHMFPGLAEEENERRAWDKVAASNYKWKCVRDFLARYPIGAYSWAAHYAESLSARSPESKVENCVVR